MNNETKSLVFCGAVSALVRLFYSEGSSVLCSAA